MRRPGVFHLRPIALTNEEAVVYVLEAKGLLRRWLAHPQPVAVGSELALSEALRIAMTEDVAQTIERGESYARLRDRYVEHNPAVMRGEPVITGTRVPVHTIASLIELGETPQVLREDYPHIPEEAYTVAVQWARANPRRGRPTRPGTLPRAIQRVSAEQHAAREVLDR